MKLTVKVFASKGTDYPIPVYEAEVDYGAEGGIWIEVFGSLRELECFILGLRAANSFLGVTDVPPVSFREDWIKGRLHEAPFQLWPEVR